MRNLRLLFGNRNLCFSGNGRTKSTSVYSDTTLRWRNPLHKTDFRCLSLSLRLASPYHSPHKTTQFFTKKACTSPVHCWVLRLLNVTQPTPLRVIPLLVHNPKHRGQKDSATVGALHDQKVRHLLDTRMLPNVSTHGFSNPGTTWRSPWTKWNRCWFTCKKKHIVSKEIEQRIGSLRNHTLCGRTDKR